MRLDSFEKELIEKFKLPLITIYKSPSDFPGQHVARLYDLDKATPYHVVETSYEDIKRTIPPHMQRLERNSMDAPIIIETWL